MILMKKIKQYHQKVEDTFNTSLEELSNQWTLNSAELEQDQAFIKYLEELDEPISEDELADWSHDINLFMEGSDNPDNLEALWEQSKAKKLWDDSLKLDQHISQTHSAEDSISIKDYMSHWCNIVQIPDSPTTQDDHYMPQKYSSEENDNLDKYDEFINELLVRVEGGWTPADHVPYNEDLLRHTFGLSLPESRKTRKSTRLRTSK